MNDQDSISNISRIQKAKFKRALIPILIVIISFILNGLYNYEIIKYFALSGLIWYLWIFFQFKINKIFISEDKKNAVLSPISGKVIDLNEANIKIKKSIFNTAEIRCSSGDEKISIQWSKKPVIFEMNCNDAGKLIGYITGTTIFEINFPSDYKLNVVCGQKITAGEEILLKREDDETT